MTYPLIIGQVSSEAAHELYEDQDANDAGNYRPPARTCPTCGMPVDKACGREACRKLAEFARTGLYEVFPKLGPVVRPC